MTNEAALLQFERVSRTFTTKRGVVRAVDDVTFSAMPGEVLCLVGESGCGKTTTGKMAAGLVRPTGGRILFEGRDFATMPERKLKVYRKAAQIVHQDPYASLNPIRTVYQTLSVPLLHHGIVRGRTAAVERIMELLTTVELTPPADFLGKYPHQLSGGQRQRVAVARALTLNPRLIVADEAVSMVDVSIRVSLLNMLLRLRDTLGVAFIFITHDLAVAKHFAGRGGRIAVMYLGRIVEIEPAAQLIRDPLHPYTQALLAAVPEADPDLTRNKEKVKLRSLEIPSLLQLPSGCTFHPRCPLFEEGLCDVQRPETVSVGERRAVLCHVVARQMAAAPMGPTTGDGHASDRAVGLDSRRDGPVGSMEVGR
ncbi:MAG: oligopeptide/dipeptide transporter, ATPase subunit [Chloroflexi bacterium]|nr:oligopeptide/dipeptide transporter, ATPase subunit [Chloroflexota bacterium]